MPAHAKRTFDFKEFSVRTEAAMPVGTDAVLLGAWTRVAGVSRILDIGTGSGVIALMMAQRTPAETVIDAIEPEAVAADEARHNFHASPWAARLHSHPVRLQDFTPGHPYDLIITNPPFFNDSLLPPDPSRQNARHTQLLPHPVLLAQVQRLLLPGGRLALILPETNALEFTRSAANYGLYPTRVCSFRSRPSKPVERTLLEFSMTRQGTEQEELVLYDNERWSDGYWALTRSFYLRKA